MTDQQSAVLSTQAASEHLQFQLPEEGGADYWFQFLVNNRRADRSPVHRIPFDRIGTGAFYTLQALADFVAFEKSRRVGELKLSSRAAEALRAFGVGEAGGSSTGRKLDYSLTAQVDQATSEKFAQLVIKSPLSVFRLSADEVQAFARELTELAAYLTGGGADGNPNLRRRYVIR